MSAILSKRLPLVSLANVSVTFEKVASSCEFQQDFESLANIRDTLENVTNSVTCRGVFETQSDIYESFFQM